MKILVANRGEIAVRVLRTCKKLGYRTVAVYSEADRDALHVRLADEAIAIGPSPAKESYLVAERIIAAAHAAGATMVHPGYGFLSENADFARACRDAKLVFIGPPPEAIAAMGNKRQAKLTMLAAGVPCVPGYEGEDQSDAALLREGQRIGAPIMVKAAAGGGGRGMRLVRDLGELEGAIRSARSEAENAFGSGELILERAVIGARHVEVQVIADAHGNTLHLGERDCSVQRRHQKIVEESPSPAVSEELRARMGEVAVRAAKAIGYRGAGTIEFLLGDDGAFYFMEMNTRLQVEHPVTELVCGVDLVEWQLLVAEGKALPAAPSRNGHAIEVRLCAEDPAQNFLPQTGDVLTWQAPSAVRVDHAVVSGGTISPFYDSMQAKIISHGATREEARRKLVAALHDTVLLGVTTNRELLLRVLDHEAFVSGDYDTSFIPTYFASLHPESRVPKLAAAIFFHGDAERLAASAKVSSALVGWNSTTPTPAVTMKLDDEVVRVASRGHGHYEVDGSSVTIHSLRDGVARFATNGVEEKVQYARDGERLWLAGSGLYTDVTFRPPRRADAAGTGLITASVDGKLLRVAVEQGATVKKGDLVAVLEAMKMELELRSDVDGIVEELPVAAGSQVKARQLVLRIAIAS